MNIRTKFKVKSVTHSVSGNEVSLVPVTSGSPENDEFFRYTPYGEIKIGLVNNATAKNFEPGAEFYVDLIPAD